MQSYYAPEEEARAAAALAAALALADRIAAIASASASLSSSVIVTSEEGTGVSTAGAGLGFDSGSSRRAVAVPCADWLSACLEQASFRSDLALWFALSRVLAALTSEAFARTCPFERFELPSSAYVAMMNSWRRMERDYGITAVLVSQQYCYCLILNMENVKRVLMSVQRLLDID